MTLEQKIAFDKVRDMISAYCATSYARNRTADETISTDSAEILHRLQLTDEMRLIAMFEDTFPTEGFTDARAFLAPLQAEHSYIDLQSLMLLRITLDTLRRVTSFFRNSKEGLYPNLKKMSEPMAAYPEISRRIDIIVDKYGSVRDNASENLYRIRQSIRENEKAINRTIASVLKQAQNDGIVDEDASVVMRDGKVLIPVSATNKSKLSGIVFDESATGKTCFIEPMAVVELNNRARELQFEQQREIFTILADFTDFLRPYVPDLLTAADYLGEIDFIHAKGMVALDMIAGMPIISEDGHLSLRRARHPLLERTLRKEHKSIVPLTVSLDSDKRILLISGPNAGGKSVCLKTVGLLQYMFQWGMLIPTSEISELPIFDSIFIDIGDDQSLENDLSTYSSHLGNMKDIVSNAGGRSLVLIDEFGSGTEPAAGGAIAEAILCQLEKNGAYGVITTHYTNLKLYASNSKGVVNGAMMFDTAAIQPLFKLEQGLPGNSFAFELARKIGLSEAIIKDAEERAGNDFVDMERQLRKIARGRRAIDEKLTRIRQTDKTLEGLTDKYQKELSDIAAQKKAILDEARAEAREILAGANRTIEQTIREIKESQADKERTRIARKALEEEKAAILSEEQDEIDRKIARKMEQIIARKEREKKRKEQRAAGKGEAAQSGAAAKPTAPKREEGPLKVGDKVRVIGGDLIGEITQIGGKTVSVAIGSITSKMALSKVERISAQQFKESLRKATTYTPPSPAANVSSESISRRRLDFSPSIDIRGEHLTEALDIVTHFIDDALMVGIGQVKILHGKGNGVLREEIRKYLKTMPGVASFKDEALEMGGSGITVVYLD